MEGTTQYEETLRRIGLEEFTLEFVLGTELAQVADFAVPSIGGLLWSTGAFEHESLKRNVDTTLLLGEVAVHGFAHPRARQAISRVNRLHSAYEISNDDYLYVLATFVIYPVRFIEAHGARPLTSSERDAMHAYYRELGRRMAVREIPDSYGALEAFLDNYERERFAFTAGGHRVALANRDRMAEEFLPRVPRKLALAIVDALVPDHVRSALKLPEPTPFAAWLVRTALGARKRWRSRFPSRRKAPFDVLQKTSSRVYPHGYDISKLGPSCPIPHHRRDGDPGEAAHGQRN